MAIEDKAGAADAGAAGCSGQAEEAEAEEEDEEEAFVADTDQRLKPHRPRGLHEPVQESSHFTHLE